MHVGVAQLVTLQHPLPTEYLLTSRRLERQVPYLVCRKNTARFRYAAASAEIVFSGGRNPTTQASHWFGRLFWGNVYSRMYRELVSAVVIDD